MILRLTVLGSAAFAAPAWASANGGAQPDTGAALALLVLIAAIAGWIGLRSVVRRLRARKAEAVIGGDFESYALEALVNAARLDGRVSDMEKRAIAHAMSDIAGDAFEAARVEAALAAARLDRHELLAYLQSRTGAFTRDQKVALIKALLAVYVSDGDFHEAEHGALVDYTEAIGFDRKTAPELLRQLSRQMVRGNIT